MHRALASITLLALVCAAIWSFGSHSTPPQAGLHPLSNAPTAPSGEELAPTTPPSGSGARVQVAADAAAAAGTEDPALQLGRYRVRVTDDAGRPLARVALEATFFASEADESGAATESRTSDAAGVAQLAGTDGAWQLLSIHATTQDESLRLIPPATFVTREFSPAEAEPEMELVIPRRCVISGRVIDGFGLPVEGAELSGASSALTDKGGRFEFLSEARGSMELRASYFGLVAVEALHCSPGEILAGLELVLPSGGWIEGRIVGEDGLGLEGCPIKVEPDESYRYESASDAVGAFRVGPLAAGEYQVIGLAQGNFDDRDVISKLEHLRSAVVTVHAGRTTEVLLAPGTGPRPRIVGQVVDGAPDGAGAGAEARILAVAEGDNFVDGISGTQTDAEGRFELQLQRPGRHFLNLIPQDGGALALQTTVDVPAAGLPNFQWAIPSGSIEVRVTGQAKSLVVELLRLDRPRGLDHLIGARREFLSEDQLNAVFQNVSAGSYRVSLRGGLRYHAPQIVELGPGERRVVELVSHPSDMLELALDPVDGSLPEHALVVVLDSQGGAGLTSAWVNVPRGSCQIGPVPHGLFSLYVAGSEGRAGCARKLVMPRPLDEEILRVRYGPGARLTLRAQRGDLEHAVSWRLFDEDGGDLTTLHLPARAAELTPVRSHEAQFGPLPPGRFRAQARDASGATRELWVDLTAGRDRDQILDFD